MSDSNDSAKPECPQKAPYPVEVEAGENYFWEKIISGAVVAKVKSNRSAMVRTRVVSSHR